MKTILTAIVAIALLPLFADSTPEAKKFLNVPDAIWSYDVHKIEEFDKTNLDKGIFNCLAQYSSWNLDESPPIGFKGFKIDLNNDGQMEYFIIHPHWGGTGGPYFFILSCIKDKWTVIGEFQGWFYLLPADKKWIPVICYGRAGQTYYRKSLLRFINGKYRETEVYIFDNGKITKEKSNEVASPNGETAGANSP